LFLIWVRMLGVVVELYFFAPFFIVTDPLIEPSALMSPYANPSWVMFPLA
jgi:hypothetical protein